MMSLLFTYSITDFAINTPRSGDIDTVLGLKDGQLVGLDIHDEVQAKRIVEHKNYKPEVQISHIFKIEHYRFKITGRMDGLYEGDVTCIEEIKSSFNVFDLTRRIKSNVHSHPYCLQLKTYGYLHYLKTGKIPKLQFLLVSSRTSEETILKIKLDVAQYEYWLKLRLQALMADAKKLSKIIRNRKALAENFNFPFLNKRPGQAELIETLEINLKKKHDILIQAPTGLGKTMGVLYPTLHESFKRGQRVIYLTPKNTQHKMAEQSVHLLQNENNPLRSLTLTSKKRLCFKNEPICKPEFCEYAAKHYDKVREFKLRHKLSKINLLTSTHFSEMGLKYEVCPYELQMEVVNDVDLVICDYNYVFSPRSAIDKLTLSPRKKTGKPNLIIDEVHNLPARMMDYFSSSLSVKTLEQMRENVRDIVKKYRLKATSLLDDAIAMIRACNKQEQKTPFIIEPPTAIFIRQGEKIADFLADYLNNDLDIAKGDPIMQLANDWLDFTSALQQLAVSTTRSFTTYNPFTETIKITCCDGSALVADKYTEFQHTIGFSATLKPFQFYSELSGFNKERLITTEFQSQFPAKNRKILIIPQISTKYSQRKYNYPRIAEVIQRIVQLKKGNYVAFFPSFDFLQEVANVLQIENDIKIVTQTKYMQMKEVTHILNDLKNNDKAHVLLAVQGGVFSEGVDYPDKMLIGAFIVGPPLPNFDIERETMRAYYQTHYQTGFDYAYTYPAMAKAIQAAGRVIRSETDKGIIVFMDNRFIEKNYSNCMPTGWFNQSPTDLVSEAILKDIQDFWID